MDGPKGCLGGDYSVNRDHVWGETMWDFVDRIPYPLLIVVALLMLLAPFYPMPHAVEKIIMLKQGTLKRPIDIFDLIFHLGPTVLLFIKLYRTLSR